MKLYELVEQALADIIKCEADPQVIINMSDWHCTRQLAGMDEPKCFVCFAGAWLRGTGYPDSADPCDECVRLTDDGTWAKLYALNSVRRGELGTAYREFYRVKITDYVRPRDLMDRHVVSYHNDPDMFKRQIRDIISHLKELDI